MKTIGIRIKGKVQGVFFRQSAKEKARELGLTGWVRNEADGAVYILASGASQELDLLVEWCRQGPPRARVVEIAIAELPFQAFPGFSIDR